MAIAEADDTGDSLAEKLRQKMALSKSTSLELYLSSDGTPIEAGATLAAQGIGDGAALDVVVSNPKVCGCAVSHVVQFHPSHFFASRPSASPLSHPAFL